MYALQGCTYTTILQIHDNISYLQGCTCTTILQIHNNISYQMAVPIPIQIFTASCINLYDIIINGKRKRLLPEKVEMLSVFPQELITTKF